MSVLYISEFERAVLDSRGQPIPAGEYPTVVPDSIVAISGSSTQSQVFCSKTKFIQYHVDVICSILIDTNPTATTTNARIAANETRFVGIGKAGMQIAVIANT